VGIDANEKRAMTMPGAVEIKMTTRGVEVRMRGRAAAFPNMDEAFAFAQKRLHDAWSVREISRRCE
jgi:hypothetical protein